MTREPMRPATMEAAAEAYRNKARFHRLCQMIVAEEMHLASRALDECMRDPYNIRETVDYLATSVAARVLQTVYDGDGELAALQKEVEQLSRAWCEEVELRLGKPPLVKP